MCEVCNTAYTQILKIPCGYYIEQFGEALAFELAYRNICLDCISSEKEFKE